MPEPDDDLYQQWWKKKHANDGGVSTAVVEPAQVPSDDLYQQWWNAKHPEEAAPEPDKSWTFTDNIITDIVKKAAAETSVGLAARAVGLSDYEEKDLGTAGNVAAGVLGFVGDPATWGGGLLGGAVVKQLTKIIGKEAAEKLVAYEAVKAGNASFLPGAKKASFGLRAGMGAIKPAVTLGAVTAARDPFQQYLETGSFSPLHTAGEVAKSAAVGALFGPAGQIPTAAGKVAGEVGAMLIPPLVEKGTLERQDLEAAIYTVAGMRVTGKALNTLLENRAQRKAAGQKDPTPSKEEFRSVDAPPEASESTRDARGKFLDEGQKVIDAATGEFAPPPAPPLQPGEVSISTEADARPFTITPTGEKVWGAAPGGTTNAVGQGNESQGDISERQGIGEVGAQASGRSGNLIEEGGQVQEKGAAVLGEQGATPESPGPFRVTGIKKAIVDRERALRNADPIIQTFRQSNPEVWAEAEQMYDENPGIVDELLGDVQNDPRPLRPREVALLRIRKQELVRAENKATVDHAAAVATGDPMQIALAETAKNYEVGRMNLFEKISRATGTEWSQSGQMQQGEDVIDLSLSGILRAEKENLGVDELPPDVVARLTKEHQAIAKVTTEHGASMAADEMRDAEAAAGEVLQKTIAEAAAERPKPGSRSHTAARKEYEDAWKKLESHWNKGLFAQPFVKYPEMIVDAVKVIRARIKLGVVTFADFMAEVKARHGKERADKLETALRDAWDQAVVEERPAPKTDLVNEAELAEYAHELNAYFVRTQGIDALKPMIDAVHGELVKVKPDITRLETIHALGRYGIFKPLDMDTDKVIVRDLKGQALQISKLAEMKKGRAALASGNQRAEPSDTERHLQQQVNKAKKKGGFVDVDPAKQLKSALESKRTWLRNRIVDLKAAIASGQRLINKRGAKGELDPKGKLTKLQAEYDTLKKDYADIFGKSGLTDEQRYAIALKAAERSAETWARKAIEGDTSSLKKTGPKAPTSPYLEAVRANRDAAKAEVQHLRDLANPKKTADERNTAALDASIKRSTADYLDRIARGDYEPKVRRVTKPSPNTERLRFEKEQVLKKFLEGKEARRRALRTDVEKIFEGGAEVLNFTRANLTAADLSATLRHGGFFAMSHPIEAFKAFRGTFGTLWSEAKASKEAYDISQRLNALNGRYKKSDVQLTDAHGKMTAMEEPYMSYWARKLPWIAASERVFIAFLNRMRVDRLDSLIAAYERNGQISDAQLKVLGNMVNVGTGRGNLGRFKSGSEVLATVFFAPKWTFSRFQLLIGQPFWKADFQSRKIIATEYARALTGVAVFYGIAATALEALLGPPSKDKDGWSIEFDPRSSDFAKVRIGQSRIDPWFGLQQATVLITRVASGETKTLKGKLRPIRGEKVPFGGGTTTNVIGRFAQTKLSPWIGTGIDVAAGQDFLGRPVTAQSVAGNLLVPISVQNIYEAMKAQNVPAATAISLLDILGMSVQTYDIKKLKKAG